MSSRQGRMLEITGRANHAVTRLAELTLEATTEEDPERFVALSREAHVIRDSLREMEEEAHGILVEYRAIQCLPLWRRGKLFLTGRP